MRGGPPTSQQAFFKDAAVLPADLAGRRLCTVQFFQCSLAAGFFGPLSSAQFTRFTLMMRYNISAYFNFPETPSGPLKLRNSLRSRLCATPPGCEAAGGRSVEARAMGFPASVCAPEGVS
jgi:hypothetical protein